MNDDVSSSSTPPPLPPSPGPTNPPVVLPLTEMGKSGKAIPGAWTLTLDPAHLAFAEAPGAQPLIILRKEVLKSAILLEGQRTLLIQKPRKLTFRLTPEGTDALVHWIGIPTLAAFYLKRRYVWIVWWASIGILGSVGTLVPLARREGGLHFDVGLLVPSVLLLVAYAFARWRPHPILFLVDSAWFSWIAINLTLRVIDGRNKAWLLFAALMAWLAVTGVRHFVRFRGTKIPPLEE